MVNCRLRDEKRDKWWQDELGKVTAKLKVTLLVTRINPFNDCK
jgi:hypothetical protein